MFLFQKYDLFKTAFKNRPGPRVWAAPAQYASRLITSLMDAVMNQSNRLLSNLQPTPLI